MLGNHWYPTAGMPHPDGMETERLLRPAEPSDVDDLRALDVAPSR
ncbi:hypothetical protein [Kutzneria kofuensis]|uniref:Uncharacterized protein n=1 Tax=Kutzneria kofuensis TaxID=103725 RepID=A0A7W9KR32_9PSEU|nr:hypothetical protein [Kutzneria kofuensis]MBB5896464.1 hypothetical protein [Kutzneria kofuensis]